MLEFSLVYVLSSLLNTLVFVPNGYAPTYLHNRIQERVPSYERMPTNCIKKNYQSHMQFQNHGTHCGYDSKQHRE